MAGRGCTVPTTSPVPSTTASRPGASRPAPSGVEKSSPVPTATGMPGGNPVRAAPCADSGPAQLSASASAGNSPSSISKQSSSAASKPAPIDRIDHGRRGQRVIHHRPARQALHQIGHRLMKARGRGGARVMPLQPADLRRHMAGIEDDARARPDERGRHIRDLLLGPAIHPDQAGRERAAVGIDGDAAVELAADAERRDLLPARRRPRPARGRSSVRARVPTARDPAPPSPAAGTAPDRALPPRREP